MEDVTEISLEEIIKLLLKHKLLIISLSILGILISLAVTTLLIKEEYVSVSKLYVYTDTTNENISQELTALNYAQKVVNTYIEMISTRSFYEKIIEDTKLDYTVEDLTKKVEYESLNQTEVFSVNVTTNAPEDSEAIARSITKIAPDVIKSFQENASLKIVDPATLPSKPSSPNLKLNLAVGLLAGLMLAVFIVFLINLFDNTIKSEEELLERYKLPVLASIPDFKELSDTILESEVEEQNGEKG